MQNGQVLIRKRGADRIRRGHVWVYRSDILREDNVEPGAIVSVREERESSGIIGSAFYSSRSQIALRFLTRGSETINDRNDNFLRERFAAADARRARLGVAPQLSRRIFSEGDALPGLIVDRYGDCVVVQTLIQATDRLLPLITKIVEERYQPRSILFRNDSRVRGLEGLELKQEVQGQPIPDILYLEDGDLQIGISLLSGQKTGAYLDQAENHRIVPKYARGLGGRGLDAFSYSGGFALRLASVCEQVEAVDISAGAVDLVKLNAERNGIRNIRPIEANVFDYLRDQFSEGVRYDTIVLDPPGFAKSRDSLPAAIRGYKEINNRAMRLLNNGGILMTCSCSHHVSEGQFAEMLAEAANDAGRSVRVLERRMQALDHPVLLTVPETMYLKCFVLEISN